MTALARLCGKLTAIAKLNSYSCVLQPCLSVRQTRKAMSTGWTGEKCQSLRQDRLVTTLWRPFPGEHSLLKRIYRCGKSPLPVATPRLQESFLPQAHLSKPHPTTCLPWCLLLPSCSGVKSLSEFPEFVQLAAWSVQSQRYTLQGQWQVCYKVVFTKPPRSLLEKFHFSFGLFLTTKDILQHPKLDHLVLKSEKSMSTN
jgi:hypothetical protein